MAKATPTPITDRAIFKRAIGPAGNSPPRVGATDLDGSLAAQWRNFLALERRLSSAAVSAGDEDAPWAAIDALEAAILRAPVRSRNDAASKLRAAHRSFARGDRTDGADARAVMDVVHWLEHGIEEAPTEPTAGPDDARLVALGARFEALLAELERRTPAYDARMQAAYAWKEQSGLHGDALLEGMRERELLLGVEDPAVDVDPIKNEMSVIQGEAETLAARSLAALRTKVMIAAYWRNKPDEDSPEIDSLLGDLKALCGLPAQVCAV